MRGVLPAGAAALMLGACVNSSERIADELVAAGLDQARAECVGRSLQGDLSLGQLRQLAAAAKAYRSNDRSPGKLTGSDLLRVGTQVQDPAVPLAVARAAGRCV